MNNNSIKQLITLTEERMNSARTPKGGYKNNQIRCITGELNIKSGWLQSIIGTQVPLDNFIQFVALGGNKDYLFEIKNGLNKILEYLKGK